MSTPINKPDNIDIEALLAEVEHLRQEVSSLKSNSLTVAQLVNSRTQVEERLKRREQEIRTLAENAPDIIDRYDRELRRVYSNPALERLIGIPIKDVLGKTNEEIGLPESVCQKWRDIAARCMESGMETTDSFVLPTKSGDKHFQIRMVPEKRASGQIDSFLAISRDVTKYVTAQQTLQESEARFRFLAENSSNVIALHTITGECTYISPASTSVLGYSPEELIGRVDDRVHPEDAEKLAKLHVELLSSQKTLSLEYRYKHRDGHYIWMESNLRILRDQNTGEVIGIQSSARDISERKKTEDALRESEERFRAFMYHSPAPAWITDEDGRTVFMSQANNWVYGISRDEVLGQKVEEVYPDDVADEYLANNRRVLETGQSIEVIEPYSRPNGTRGQALVCKFPLVNSTGKKLIGGIGIDVTDRLRDDEERHKVQKLESVGLLAGGIAHDFNNILTAIAGYISLAKLEAMDLPDLDQLLGEAEEAVFRAQTLTQQLLTFARGGAPIRKKTQLQPLLEEATRFALTGTKVKPEFKISPDLYTAELDEGQIRQVIHNLVINAVQAMPDGGIITIGAENYKEPGKGKSTPAGDKKVYVKISIADTGTGIPNEYITRIFDPYFTTKQHGSGLGLATSYSIISKHQGMIKAESEPGHGTVFSIYLPAMPEIRSSEINLPDKEMPATHPATHTGSSELRVLLVDDEVPILELIQRFLSRNNYRVDTAQDGNIAIELYKQMLASGEKYDLVIMDLTLPGSLDGRQALEKLKELDPTVMAVVASGYATDPIVSQYQAYGFAGALIKPYHLEQLKNLVEKLLSPDTANT